MKRNLCFFVLIFVVSVLLLSCASMMGVAFTPYSTYTQLPPSERVQVLNVAPTKTYIELGEIKAEGFSDEAVLQRITNKAKEAGADAVVIIERQDKSQNLPGLRIWRTIAIKY